MRATETSIPDDVALASLSAQVGERLRASHQIMFGGALVLPGFFSAVGVLHSVHEKGAAPRMIAWRGPVDPEWALRAWYR